MFKNVLVKCTLVTFLALSFISSPSVIQTASQVVTQSDNYQLPPF